MKGKIFWGIVLLIILSIFIFYFSCTKNSIRYEYEKKQYLYANGGWIYVFSTENDALVDSISLGPNISPGALGLAPDKKTLYVWASFRDTLNDTISFLGCEIDTRTKIIKYIGPNSFPVISPDGKYLFGEMEGKFAVFDAFTHQVVYRDTVLSYFYPICFDDKKHLAYGAAYEKFGQIMALNYESKSWVRSFTVHLRDGSIPGIGDCVLSPDGNTLYLLVYTYSFYFCVYDLTKDSLLVQLGVNAIGQLGIKPDGSTVYLTDPGGGSGCISWEPPPTGVLGVFDTKTNMPLPSISLDPLADSLHVSPLPAHQIRITSDGKKAYLSTCGNLILIIDLVRNEPLKTIVVPKRNLMFYSIAL